MGGISFIDRVNISIAGHSISQDFHLTDPQLGRIFSAFFLGYGLFQIAGGWAVDRLGPRRVLALGAAWWAAFTALTASFPAGIAQAFLIIWSVRFLLGMGESVMYPSSNRWVANWIPTAERGLGQRPDLRRRGRGLGLHASHHPLRHGPPGLALGLLGVRRAGTGGRRGMVLDGARPS